MRDMPEEIRVNSMFKLSDSSKDTLYILKSTVDAKRADLQKEIDQNLELWEADIADYDKEIADLKGNISILELRLGARRT